MGWGEGAGAGGGGGGTCGRKEKCIQGFGGGHVKEGGNMVHKGADGDRLKSIFKK
jgi:hypothetical protein